MSILGGVGFLAVVTLVVREAYQVWLSRTEDR